jgi:hypothetical protein
MKRISIRLSAIVMGIEKLRFKRDTFLAWFMFGFYLNDNMACFKLPLNLVATYDAKFSA